MTGVVSNKILSKDEVERAVEEVVDLAASGNVRVALAGGVAMQLYRSDRFTKDVDFVAGSSVPGLEVEKTLTFGGYSSKTPSGVPVDIILRSDDYRDLYDFALDAAEDSGLRTAAGNVLLVISPACLAAMKLAASREKDLEDLRKLVELGLVGAETREVTKSFLGKYAARELDSIVEETKWLMERGKR